MTSTLTSHLLEKIKITERELERLDNKILGLHSWVKTTREIVDSMSKKRVSFSNPFLIRRNMKLDFILSLIVCLVTDTSLIYFLSNKKLGDVIGIVFVLILVLLLHYILYKNLTVRNLILPISITDKQIEIIGEVYQWNLIENTFFVFRPRGKGFSAYFIIGFKNEELKYFDIQNQLGFKYNENDFSEIIEYFKNEYNTKQKYV